MAIAAKLDINEGDFKKRLTKHVRVNIIAPALHNHVRNRGKEYRDIILNNIKETPAWKSIRGDFAGQHYDDLQAVFGLDTPQILLEEIETIIRRSISLRVINETYIRISISAQVAQALIDSDEGSYMSNGHLIPWMEWALFEKGRIEDYVIKFDLDPLESKHSRTGEAIMISNMQATNQGDILAAGQGWSLDPSVQGIGTNFLKQATENGKMELELGNLFKSTFVQNIQKQL